MGYGILRFISELFRDNPQYLVHYTNHYLGVGMLTLTQIFTPLILGLGIAGLRWRGRVNAHTVTVPAANPAAAPAVAAAAGGAR